MSKASLEIVRGQRVGDRYTVSGRVLVGRDIDCDIQIFDEGLSRAHFVIERKNDGFEIKEFMNGMMEMGPVPVRHYRERMLGRRSGG